MKIVAISDTHSYHRKLTIPDGDILIHSGDITHRGELSIMKDFSNWLKELPHKNKVIVFGNHELGLESGPNRNDAINMIKDADAHYLENSAVEIDGYKIYGSPCTPRFYDWEWNRNRGKDIAMEWAKIPNDTEILITHGPGWGVLDLIENNLSNKGRDLHQGCEELTKRIKDLKNLKAHFFGHLHSGYGMTKIDNVVYANAACCTEQYKPTNPPIIVEI